MLTLEVELLTDLYRASVFEGSTAEWPPHTDRIFSALVQAWADGGKIDGEREVLEWLESQPPPAIEASPPGEAPERDAPLFYVPPNDMSGADPAVLPDARSRRERRFRARVPAAPQARLQWNADASPTRFASLRALVHRVASIGHSSSLVRCSIRADAVVLDRRRVWRLDPDGAHAVRSLYPGRLKALERWFSGGRRPESPVTFRYRAPESDSEALEATNTRKSVFGGPENWFVFADRDGTAPDLLAFAHVAARARDALMQLAPQPPPEILTGHSPDGGPSRLPHAAIVPLANVGWPYSNGDLLGFAVVLPRRAPGAERDAALRAIARFAGLTSHTASSSRAELRLGRAGVWGLEREPSPLRSSLKPERWCEPARTWASATPVLLDRYSTNSDPVEEAAIVAAACDAIGLAEELVAVEFHKHSAVRGAPSAYPDRGVRYRPGWSFPERSRLRERIRRHVVLEFARPVQGPILLGAGRFRGFGMCLPLGESS